MWKHTANFSSIWLRDLHCNTIYCNVILTDSLLILSKFLLHLDSVKHMLLNDIMLACIGNLSDYPDFFQGLHKKPDSAVGQTAS